MRRLPMTPLASVVLLALAACGQPKGPQTSAAAAPAPAAAMAGPLSPDQLPHQKPGLWRTAMTIEGMSRTLPVTEMCIDAATEAKMSVWRKTMRDGQCASSEFSRNVDGSISFKTTCDLGPGGKKVDSGTISGDLNANYKVAIDSITTGSAIPQANGEHKMSIAATWLGPCAPGQQGGEVIMPDGRKMRIGG